MRNAKTSLAFAVLTVLCLRCFGARSAELPDGAVVGDAEKVSISVHDADIRDVIMALAVTTGNLNVIFGPEVSGKITLNLKDVPSMDAMNAVARTLDFVVIREVNNSMRVMSLAKYCPQLETRIFRVSVSDKPDKDGKSGVETFIEKLKSAQSDYGRNCGKISYDNETHSLTVRDTESALDAMQVLINTLKFAP